MKGNISKRIDGVLIMYQYYKEKLLSISLKKEISSKDSK